MNAVLCIGGPKHGERMGVKGDRFHVHMPAPLPPIMPWDPDENIPYEPMQTATYYVQRWRDCRGDPERRREIRVALFENSLITCSEEAKLDNDLRQQPWDITPAPILKDFEMTTHHTGESLDNLLKIFHIVETDPDVSLFVQANPAFCCPSLVTEAMAGRIEEVTGVPVITLTYDGTTSSPNDALIPHLRFPRRRKRGRVAGHG